jgi:general secretion pathway protein C
MRIHDTPAMRRPLKARLSTIGWPAWFATLGAAAVLAATLAYWAMLVASPTAPVGPSRKAVTSTPMNDPRSVAALFGQSGVASEAGPAVAGPASAAIQVAGIVAAGRRGSAMLVVDGKPLRAYAVGDLVTPSIRLRAVRPDAVILDEAGRERSLPAPPRTSPAVLGMAPVAPAPAAR